MFAIDIDRKILHHVPDRQSDSHPDESRTQMSSLVFNNFSDESLKINTGRPGKETNLGYDQYETVGI